MENQRQILIRLPEIYDCGGKVSPQDKWLIIFSVRNPRTGKMVRIRKAQGINKYHTLKERRAAAEKMKKYWSEKLKAGWSPFNDSNIIYDDNLEFQTAVKNYRKLKSKNGTFRFYASKYLDSRKNEVESTTISTYRSKFRLFSAWLENRGLHEADISVVTQPLMCEFMYHIIEDEKLSKVSVDNYRILLETLFNFIRKDKERKLFPNPCFDLPGTKRINDSAAAPINEDDIPIFKETIIKKDPQLWLTICFEYYCFMRPRKEIRFLRIGDIDFGMGQIRIRYENAKTSERFVTIPKPFLRLIREFYKLHTYPRHFFVIGKKGVPGPDSVSINNLSNRFVRFRETLNMPDMYKLYSWKHTGVIRARNAGIPDREIQTQAGHTSIVTTERYMRKMMAVPSPILTEKIVEL